MAEESHETTDDSERPEPNGALFENQRFFKIDELAQYLNVTPRSIQRWQSRGEIPFVKLGRALRFDRKEIEKWVARRAHLEES